MPELHPLTTLSAAVLLGVMGQTLGSLTRMPAIVFLLALGVAGGPYGLGLINPDTLGSGLPVLTSAFVAIILFEGSLTLRPGMLREAISPVRRLITWGAALTLVGAAVLARFLGGLPWPLAFSFAALVVVTGPTVIAPILRRVPLQARLQAVLKSESILIDPVGVFIAVIMFEYVAGLSGEATWSGAALGFFGRVGVGGAVGTAAGLLVTLLTRLAFFRRRENEHLVSLGTLGVALAAFAIAERIQPESGVMAVIAAGLILAWVPLPFREELEKFKDLLTTLGVSVLFILLAADLDLSLLLIAGWGEVALLLGLMFVVRPMSVFLSTWGTALNWREKALLSLLAPRGILAAAMASYFAAQLRQQGLPGANRIELLVFLTIATTVFLQGGWAGLLARLLRVRAERGEGVLLVGINEWSLALAELLRSRKRLVLFLDDNALNCEMAAEHGFEAIRADATEPAMYDRLDLANFGELVAMTPNDAVNTLACEAARPWLREREPMQILSRPGTTAPRARVRMGGIWALPTALPHREVTRLLREGELVAQTETVTQATSISAEMLVPGGRLIPMLAIEKGRLRIAVEGQPCPPRTVLLGLLYPESWASSQRPAC